MLDSIINDNNSVLNIENTNKKAERLGRGKQRKVQIQFRHVGCIEEQGRNQMDRETVVRVAKVARLRLSEEELTRYEKDLEEILQSFEVLDEAPSSEVFDFNPVKIKDTLREDEVRRDIDPYELTKSMDTYDGFVRGPKLS